MARDLRTRPPVIYEIFPRAFLDTTGSGAGDLKGVLDRLGYIRDLGVDAIWLAPFYPSPLRDGGYDIINHRAVDPAMGTLDDFDAIVAKADEMELGILVDLVFNHTSDDAPTFRAALEGDDDAAAHYVFADPKPDGSAPNNWMSFFGGPAWYWSHQRSQYYFHQFTEHQPSLNLRHAPVQDDLRKTVEFWTDRGVSGFRLDVVTAYLFDPDMRDNPPASPEVAAEIEGPANSPYAYQDHLHDILPGDGAKFVEKIRAWAGDDIWLLGECNTGNKSLEIANLFCEPGRLDAVYTTDIVECARVPAAYENVFDAQPNDRWVVPWWFSSHDQARPASNGEAPPEAMAKFYATLLCALPGPLLLYQGEELGLPQPDLDKDEISDPFDLRFWPDPAGRAGARVPIPWTAEPDTYGFTSGTPFLPMRWATGMSMAEQDGSPSSVLSYYRDALALRHEAGFAATRDHDLTVQDDRMTLSITSEFGSFRAVFNFGQTNWDIPTVGETRLSTHPTAVNELPPFSARIEQL